MRESIRDNKIYQYNGNAANGKFTYVMDSKGDIILGQRVNPNNSAARAPHPTLIGSKDPQVQCAGIIELKNGKIF